MPTLEELEQEYESAWQEGRALQTRRHNLANKALSDAIKQGLAEAGISYTDQDGVAVCDAPQHILDSLQRKAMERAKIPPKDKRELEQAERKNNARFKEAQRLYFEAKDTKSK